MNKNKLQKEQLEMIKKIIIKLNKEHPETKEILKERDGKILNMTSKELRRRTENYFKYLV